MRKRSVIAVGSVVGLASILIVMFPAVARFAEGAAMDLRRFWWLVLLVSIAIWTVWVLKKRNRG